MRIRLNYPKIWILTVAVSLGLIQVTTWADEDDLELLQIVDEPAQSPSGDVCPDITPRSLVNQPNGNLFNNWSRVVEGLDLKRRRRSSIHGMELLELSPNVLEFEGNSPQNKAVVNKLLEKIRMLNFEDQQHISKNLRQVNLADFKEFAAEAGSLECDHAPNADCVALQRFAQRVAIRAYNVNVEKSFVAIATRHKVPLVYREPSVPSQALQQNNYPTKRLDLKNKSSLLPLLEGFVTFNGYAGKVGDKFKEFLKKYCEGDGNSCPIERQGEYQHLLDAIHHEEHMSNAKLAVRNSDGSLHYSKVPVTRLKQGILEIAVYADPLAHSTKWVPFVGLPPRETAWVLGDLYGRPITADTDMVFIGQPRSPENKGGSPSHKGGSPEHKVGYHPLYGFRTGFDDKIRKELNEEWNTHTGNANQIIQHGDEANFGLNPLDDVLVAVDHTGRISRFDLTKGHTEEDSNRRSHALESYATWLVAESKYSDIILPTKPVQHERRKSMGDSAAFFDFTDSRRDYDVIERIFKEHNTPFVPLVTKSKEQ
jgi:hypothetical protein